VTYNAMPLPEHQLSILENFRTWLICPKDFRIYFKPDFCV